MLEFAFFAINSWWFQKNAICCWHFYHFLLSTTRWFQKKGLSLNLSFLVIFESIAFVFDLRNGPFMNEVFTWLKNLIITAFISNQHFFFEAKQINREVVELKHFHSHLMSKQNQLEDTAVRTLRDEFRRFQKPHQ